MAEHLRSDPDLELAREAAAGSREAFDGLVRRHQTRIYNLMLSLTGGDSEAEDLAQEVFVRAFRSVGRFRADSTFRTWLFQIALNVARSHRARLARFRHLWGWPAETRDEAETEDSRDAPRAPGADVETTLVQREAIDRALGRLPPDLRQTVVLRDVHGFEYQEIAAMMGVPIGTVESRLFRARQRLRRLIEPHLRSRPAAGSGPGGVPNLVPDVEVRQ